MLNDVEFREVQEITKIDKVKIVACDGKSKFIRIYILLKMLVIIFFQMSMMKEALKSENFWKVLIHFFILYILCYINYLRIWF